jgi:hypothetical protein
VNLLGPTEFINPEIPTPRGGIDRWQRDRVNPFLSTKEDRKDLRLDGIRH